MLELKEIKNCMLAHLALKGLKHSPWCMGRVTASLTKLYASELAVLKSLRGDMDWRLIFGALA